jgi:GNAT superfamily N-acetyltransferase
MNVLRSIPRTGPWSDPKPLSGSLEHLSVPDLLQTAEANRRSGRIVLRGLPGEERSGRLWMRDGRIADAEVDGGPRGREAVYEMALWETGTFEADFSFGMAGMPERIFEPVSALLLEAMRQRDEQLRDEAPPHAAIPDPPPAPPRPLLALHRALTLLNVAASSAASHLEPALVARRLEDTRRETATEHPVLAMFRVAPAGAVTAAVDSQEALGLDPDALVRGVGRWLVRLYAVLERALPGRFSARRLRAMTEAVQEDLASFGFYRELGLSPLSESPETPGLEIDPETDHA